MEKEEKKLVGKKQTKNKHTNQKTSRNGIKELAENDTEFVIDIYFLSI